MFIRVKRTVVRKTCLEFEVSWCGRRWQAIKVGIAKTWAKAHGVREREFGSRAGSRPVPARAPARRR